LILPTQAEVYSDDLSKIYFFQQHSHPETLPQYLEPSHYIRQCVLEMARTFGLSPAQIKRRMHFPMTPAPLTQLLTGLLYLMDEDHIPNYRRFDAKGVDNIVSNARRKDRLLSDPLLSIGVFARSNPDKIFQFVAANRYYHLHAHVQIQFRAAKLLYQPAFRIHDGHPSSIRHSVHAFMGR
jgi:hypothetical protein